MMGWGGGGVGEGCCSEVLWDTRLYHDGGGGGVALKSYGIQGCTMMGGGGRGVALKSYGIQGCTMMGGGGGCSEVLWDTRLYHDSEGVGGGGMVCHPGYV